MSPPPSGLSSRRARRWLLVATLAAALGGCGGTPADGAPADAPGTGDARGGGGDGGGGGGPLAWHDPAVGRVVIEIDHEAGQAPYTGAMTGGGDTFDLATANLARAFGAERELVLPRTAAAMEDIGVVADEELTVPDILALAAAHRDAQDAPGAPGTKAYYLLFVSGYFADASGPQPSVLGVSLGGNTGIIVMFKDVIRGTANLTNPNTPRYVEQATIIHEVGHAIGLVDNGIAATTPHRDADHGPHCTNRDCVMYWLNEGASEATAFALRRILTRDELLFDAACLADLDAAAGR